MAGGHSRASRRFAPTSAAYFVGVSRRLALCRLPTAGAQEYGKLMTQFFPAATLDMGEPIGRMFNVGGRSVHMVEMGFGSPTVWLENGWLGVTLGWQPFQQMLAEHTRVCAYDRAGNAWSDPSCCARTAQNEADEFAALLDALDETEPIILLAWSGGGPVAQIFAADHPGRVAGLILMDAISPDYDLWATQAYPERYPREQQEQLEIVRAFAEKAATGELRECDIADWLTPEIQRRFGERYLKLLLNNPNYWWTYYWQNQYIIASGAQARSKASLGELPLTVIVAEEPNEDADLYQQSLGQMWRALQVAQARLSTRGKVAPVAAGHAVFRERPQAVIDVVLDTIAAVNCRLPEGATLVGA